MSQTKRYISTRSNFTILQPPATRTEIRDGEKVHVRDPANPIEFSNGEYVTDDPDEQKVIEENAAFDKRGLEHGDVAPAPQTEELVQAAEEAPEEGEKEESLEERLEGATSQEEVAEILEDAGISYSFEDRGAGFGSESQGDSEEEPESGELEEIEGVENKTDALNALESIEEVEGVDFGVTSNNTVDEIVEAAEAEGYTFADYP